MDWRFKCSGDTIGHGLNAVPTQVIIKKRTNTTGDWNMLKKWDGLGDDFYILN